MRFIEFLKEATAAKGKTPAEKKKEAQEADNHVAITFGRFNPPHAGHGKLLDAVKAHGGDSGNYRIYPSRSQDHKKNPLGAQQKVDHMRKLFKGHKDAIQNNEGQRNVFDILRDLNDEGKEHVTMVVGDDRVKEFEKLTSKYNGIHYDFKSIQIKSAGKRDPKSEDPTEKLSASAQRKHASGDDHDSFHAGMPKGTSKKHSKTLMKDVIAGMTPPKKESKKKDTKKKKTVKEGAGWHSGTVWEYAPKLDFEAFRDHYMLDQIFKVGALVEHDDTGLRGHVVHRGTNYIIMKDERNIEVRAWLQHVTEVTDDLGQLNATQIYAADTSKDQSNYSADDGSGNDWKIGTDTFRAALQDMTPGQSVKKFSDFRAEIRKPVETK